MSLGNQPVVAMDLEAMLRAVQNNRASLLDQQLTDQITAIRDANASIAAYNALLTAANRFAASSTDEAFAAVVEAARAAAIDDRFLHVPAAERAAALSGLISTVKGKIDSTASSQPREALRLQALTDKRNESLDLMTDFMKKMQDERSRIIASMRSEPVDVGTLQWDGGVITGAIDLSRVPAGEHHLVLGFADAGLTVISTATVGRPALPATGIEPTPAPLIAAGLLLLGLVTMCAPALRRGRRAAN